MDVQEVAGQFLSSVADDPDQINQFNIDPAKTLKDTIGVDLQGDQLKSVIAVIEPLIQGKGLNMDAVIKCAGDFFGDNPGKILENLGGLFGGGGAEDKEDAEGDKESKDGNPLDVIGSIAGDLFGGK